MSTDKPPPPPTRDVEWKVEMACRILDGTPASDQSAALEAAAGALAKAEAEYEAAVDAFEAAGKAYRDAVDELTQAGDQWERASEQESKEAGARSDAASKAVTKAFRGHRLATLTFDEAMDVLGDPLEAARRITADALEEADRLADAADGRDYMEVSQWRTRLQRRLNQAETDAGKRVARARRRAQMRALGDLAQD